MKNNHSNPTNSEPDSIVNNENLSQDILKNIDAKEIFIDGIVQRVCKTINKNIRIKSGENLPESIQDNIYARMSVLHNAKAESIRIKDVIQLIEVTINQYVQITSEELAETIFDSLTVMFNPQASCEDKKSSILLVLEKIIEQEELEDFEKELMVNLYSTISNMKASTFERSLASKDGKLRQRIGIGVAYTSGVTSTLAIVKREDIAKTIEETINFLRAQTDSEQPRIDLDKPSPKAPTSRRPEGDDLSSPQEDPKLKRSKGNPPSPPQEDPKLQRPKSNPPSPPQEDPSPGRLKDSLPIFPIENRLPHKNLFTTLPSNFGNPPQNTNFNSLRNGGGGGGGGSMFPPSNPSDQMPQVGDYMALSHLMTTPSSPISGGGIDNSGDLGGGSGDLGISNEGDIGACDGIDIGSCDGIDIGDCGGCEPSIECFIATAVYGDPYAPQVVVLRYFRDTTLTNNHAGRLFISGYYRFSPPIAQRLKRSKYLSKLVRYTLDILVKCVKK